ncbi:hypothetical protein OSTOST_08146 [Ostertagia ostertagi]
MAEIKSQNISAAVRRATHDAIAAVESAFEKAMVVNALAEILMQNEQMGGTTRGNWSIITIVNHFSNYLGAHPVPDKKADTIAEVIFSQWICIGGRWPESIFSDRGGEFENAVVKLLCHVPNIKRNFAKRYCPRENGLTERANRTTMRIFKKKAVVPA